MDDGSLDETTGCDMIKEKTLSLTSPPPNNNRLDIDECAISSKHNFPNRNETVSFDMCNLESSQDGQIPNDKLDDGACAVPVDEIADSAVPFNVKKDMQMAWGDIETRRRNLDCKRDKLKQLRAARGRREGEAIHIQSGIQVDATVDALISFDAPLNHGKNTTLITGSQVGSVHLTSGGGQEVRLVKLA
ncbi:hypothetical protein FIBSPDRAFT_1049142 [Athelia psychrophila]|uniref:Uncharacterized protein n=1 Tax=Athelia psychrophila TaxID=1759441 RepID=A0A166CP97_9AGAM|nr:hypothetical protein FIBSPDRAFT_1049142 [Fibularhizoctonia sp. CBS 109695]